MKCTYSFFCEQIESGMELDLNYFDKKYHIYHDNINWYFTEDNNIDSQKFSNSNDLIENAKINGKLLSEIWDDITVSGDFLIGSGTKIALRFTGSNLDFDDITKIMGITPTKIIKKETNIKGFGDEWTYLAFTREEDNALNMLGKTIEFVKIMAGKEEAINILKQKYKDRMSVFLTIVGNDFLYRPDFAISLEFITFANKINTTIGFLDPNHKNLLASWYDKYKNNN